MDRDRVGAFLLVSYESIALERVLSQLGVCALMVLQAFDMLVGPAMGMPVSWRWALLGATTALFVHYTVALVLERAYRAALAVVTDRAHHRW